MISMTRKELPTNVEELQKLLLQAEQRLAVAEQQSAELSVTVEEQLRKIEKQEQAILDLLAALRGKQRERIDPNQLLLFDLGELEDLLEEQAATADEPPASKRKRRRNGRRVLPDNLPTEEILHELPEDQRRCPFDGTAMQFVRWEVSKQLDYQPSVLKCLIHKRAVYACRTKHDSAKLITAEKPPQPIEKGLAAPGLLAALALGKFGDHLPGYRLEDILFRHGVEIRRSTIYDWLSATADVVAPLVDLMRRRVLQSKVIHTDDTKVKLIDTTLRGTRLARYWAYVGDPDHPYIVYDFTPTRERIGPERFLKGFAGYLQADAYGGYDGIYLKSQGAILEVACWSHCRRYWWKAREQDPPRAHHVLAVIARLNTIEMAAKDRTSTERQQLRAQHAQPLLDELKNWMDEQEPSLLPKSLIAQAATYTRNQWDALCRYIEDGDLSIDNNLSERTVKPIAIGRRNWLFVGSEQAGQRSARLMSLVASCKENRVEPFAYLRDVLTRLPQGADLESLLPDPWLAAHPEHRWTIADIRAEEREAKGYL